MKSIARSINVENTEHLQALLLAPVISHKRFASLFSYVRQFLPAKIDVLQSTPHGSVHVLIERENGETYRVRSADTSRLALF